MKNIVVSALALVTVFLSSGAVAQSKVNTNKFWRRIVLTEKKNTAFKEMPRLLLQAFCEGRLRAYYPNEPETEAPFSSFAYHFDFNTVMTQGGEQGDVTTPCIESQCADPFTQHCFSFYLDVYEEEYIDRNISRVRRKAKMVRLVYSHTCSDNGLEYYGPLFRIEDLPALSKRFKVPVEGKGDRLFSMEQIFIQKLYDSVIVEHNGTFIQNPAKYTAEFERRRTDRENSLYEN